MINFIKVLFILGLSYSAIANADEHRLGNFQFNLASSWKITGTNSALNATNADGNLMKSAFLKIAFCIPKGAESCEVGMFFPPANQNPENYFCGETKPTTILHDNGVKEMRKICSITKQNGRPTEIGMLHLTSGQSTLAFILFTEESSSVTAAFLDTFISSLVVK
jgi:hypothetical protein